MNKLIRSAVLALLVVPTMAVAQDFDKGLAAAQTGDFATALQEFTPLAEQGNAWAQYNLGLMYDFGQGVTQDYAEAARWFRLSADQGYAPPQFNLGVMYSNGQGVTQDYAEAVKWYRLAAEQGDAEAQSNLGIMYANGQGVPQDFTAAHMWFNIAAANGNELGGTNRDNLAKDMTPASIEEAQRRARVCMASNYQDCD